jgi:hypothetical protein
MTKPRDGSRAPVTLRTVSRLDDMPQAARALFADPAVGPLFATAAWFECVIEAALPRDAQPCFVIVACGHRVLAVVPLRIDAHRHGPDALTTPYTCLYRPLLAPRLSPTELAAAGRAFGRFCRRFATARLDAMAGDDAELAGFWAGARRAGIGPIGFLHFANWHEDVGGLAWPAYLAARPGRLRETIRRRLARAERDRAVSFDILRAPADADRAAEIYAAVYASSWKEPEPFPAFNATLIVRAAALGLLRLGVLRLDGRPVAVQFWIVCGGVATVLKLAHDEAVRAMSPGTVLMAMMVRHLLEVERVASLDFGRGDDAYKKEWANRRRERVGVVLVNPMRPAGLAFALRHYAGRALRRLRAV